MVLNTVDLQPRHLPWDYSWCGYCDREREFWMTGTRTSPFCNDRWWHYTLRVIPWLFCPQKGNFLFISLVAAKTQPSHSCHQCWLKGHSPNKKAGAFKIAICALSKLLFSTKQLMFLCLAGKLSVAFENISQPLLHNDFLLCFEVFPGHTIGSFVHSLASSTESTTCFTGGILGYSANSNHSFPTLALFSKSKNP